MHASNGWPVSGVDGATAACVDYDADVSGGSLEHLLALTASVVTPAPSKAFVQRRQATGERSKLRNSSNKADCAKDLTAWCISPKTTKSFTRP